MVTVSNTRLIAELQAVQIGLTIVGGDLKRLPEVMRPVVQAANPSTCGTQPKAKSPQTTPKGADRG